MAEGMTEVVTMMEVSKKINNNDDADDRRERTNGRQKSTKASARGVDGDKNRSCNQCNFTLEPSLEHTRQLPRLDVSLVPTVLYRNTACRNTTHNHDQDTLGDLDPEVVAPLLYPMHDMSYKNMHHDVKGDLHS